MTADEMILREQLRHLGPERGAVGEEALDLLVARLRDAESISRSGYDDVLGRCMAERDEWHKRAEAAESRLATHLRDQDIPWNTGSASTPLHAHACNCVGCCPKCGTCATWHGHTTDYCSLLQRQLAERADALRDWASRNQVARA